MAYTSFVGAIWSSGASSSWTWFIAVLRVLCELKCRVLLCQKDPLLGAWRTSLMQWLCIICMLIQKCTNSSDGTSKHSSVAFTPRTRFGSAIDVCVLRSVAFFIVSNGLSLIISMVPVSFGRTSWDIFRTFVIQHRLYLHFPLSA